MKRAAERLDELAARYDLPAATAAVWLRLLEALRDEPTSLTTVRDPRDGADVHIADSLAGLDVAAVREAGSIADLGSGTGFPGLVLASALPTASVALVESVGRKCDWLERAVGLLELERCAVVCARAEAWPAGLGAHELVTARALAPLAVLLEYAAPLLREGGSLLAWKGHRDDGEERAAAAAGAILGMAPLEIRSVEPWPTAGARHLHLWSKVSPTPARFPRRAGMARKRPLRAST